MANPEEGSRVFKAFVRVENGVPLAFDNTPLNWRTDNGLRPSDEWLAEQGYYGFVDNPPAHDPETEVALRSALAECVVDDQAGTVTQTYTVRPLNAAELEVIAAGKNTAVTRERDRRIASGFDWNGTRFDARPEDKTRIAGAAQLAFMYLVNNGDPAAVDWNDPGSNTAFGWISANNSVVSMTAPEVIDFAKTAARWESLNVFAARNLKDTPGGVPVDYAANNAYWPDPTNFMT